MSDLLDINRVAEDHHKSTAGPWCHSCSQDWPCDTQLLIARAANAAAEMRTQCEQVVQANINRGNDTDEATWLLTETSFQIRALAQPVSG